MKSNLIALIFIVCISFKTYNCKAQLIDNKINIYAEYLTGIFHGKELVQEKNFIYPSLYNNFKNINGFSVKVLYKNRQHISLGIGMTFCNVSNWEYINHLDYQGSEIKMGSISPTIQIHSKFSESGVFNRGRYFVEFAPVFGISSFKSSKPLFDIQSSNGTILSPTKSTDMYYGIKGNVGIEWAISQSVGFCISYSLQHNRIKSKLYSDPHFTNSQLNIGLILKLKKDKRFLYR